MHNASNIILVWSATDFHIAWLYYPKLSKLVRVANCWAVAIKMLLGVEEVLNILRTEEAESFLPFRPKGREVFVFKWKVGQQHDWRANEDQWVKQGTVNLPRNNPMLKK